MKLTKIKLHNFAQHKSLEKDLTGNIVGVIGHNGAGKSNMLGAIQFALGGEVPGVNKSELLSWGESSGYAEVHFVHNGVKGYISRAIHSPAVKFVYGTDEYNGSVTVAEAIYAHLGMDKDLLKQAIFVRQAEIDSILFTEPRVRELAFQKLCGIGEANKIYKRIGDILSGLPVYPDLDIQVSDNLKQREELKSREENLQKNINSLSEIKSKLPERKELQDSMVRNNNLLNLLTSYAAGRDHAKDMLETVTALENDLKAKFPNTPDPSKIAEIDGVIQSAEKLIAETKMWQEKANELVTARTNLSSISSPVLTPVPDDAELAKLKEEASSLWAQYNSIVDRYKLYDSLCTAMSKFSGSSPECPVCGSAITDSNKLVSNKNEAKESCTAVHSAYTKASESYKAMEAASAKAKSDNLRNETTYTTRKTALESKIQELTDVVDKLKPTVEVDIVEAQSLLTQLKTDRVKYLTAMTQYNTANSNLQAEKKAYDRSLQALAETVVKIKALDPNISAEEADIGYSTMRAQAAIENCKDSLKELDTITSQWSQLIGMMEELHRSISTVDAAIATLKDKQTKQRKTTDTIGILTKVRDWFHYSNGPKILTSQVLNSITDDVNRFLGNFTAPFTVIPDPDVFGFRIVFHDGRQMPSELPEAAKLSGGEKIQLATSFRLASYVMFASNQGMLVLDEPTAYLDDANVGRFGPLLEKVKEIAKKMDLQILISTHEQSIIPFFDSVIDLN